MLLELVLVIVVYVSPVLCVGLRYCLVVGFMIGRHFVLFVAAGVWKFIVLGLFSGLRSRRLPLVPALGRLGMLALFVSLL